MAIVAGDNGQGWLRELADDGTPQAPIKFTTDLATTITEHDNRHRPRWIIAELATGYATLLHRNTRLGRAHDITLTEAIVLSTEGRGGEPHSLAAAHARLHDLPVPPSPHSQATSQETLFDTTDKPDGPQQLDTLVEVHADQQRRAGTNHRLQLLIAAESAGGLIAAEMTHHGLPWRTDIHDAVLTDLLGPKPVRGMRPKKLQALADDIATAFGHAFNPDSPQQVLAAFKADGHPVHTTRASELKTIDHPAVTPLLRYKELARIYSGHGWNWAKEWISDGPQGAPSPSKRFRPRYVVGGVVTGRWATDGGAALQMPKVIRRAVTADDRHQLVVADASQLEPRILAAMSGDPGMTQATEADDMYAALAPTFNGNREDAKIALLSAMYGGTAGNATALLSVMRSRFPRAYDFVDSAAKIGEKGGLVHTWLGRTCPPASSHWWNALSRPEGTRSARDRGRFTRNFIVQGTAAEWALAMMALLRNRLFEADLGQLVFFQHDEVVVHCPQPAATQVSDLIQQCADEATRLLFGDTIVRIPLHATTVTSYADSK
jgi:DNA polymerase-1